MERTKKVRKPDAIAVADIHLREDIPVCRVDDFQAALWAKMDYISALARKYDCPVLHSGDLFHHWKPSPYLLSLAIAHMPPNFITVYGNHDLPQHNMDLKEKSGIYTLERAGALTVVPGGHWNKEVDGTSIEIKGRKILLIHIMTYKTREPFPGCTAPKGNTLLRKYPEYDLIITGDNHKPFTETHKGRTLVNPGSISRQEASQINFRPRVYFYYADTNTVEPHYLPINADGVVEVTVEHLEAVQQREERMNAFISRLKTDIDISISFEENMKQTLNKNKVRKSVIQIVNQAME